MLDDFYSNEPKDSPGGCLWHWGGKSKNGFGKSKNGFGKAKHALTEGILQRSPWDLWGGKSKNATSSFPLPTQNSKLKIQNSKFKTQNSKLASSSS